MNENQPNVELNEGEVHYPADSSVINPFVKSSASTGNLMAVMLTALIIDSGTGIYRYGIHALILIAVAVISAAATEALFGLVLKRGLTISDCSAMVTGMITGLILPPSVPYYFAAIGAVTAITVKCVSGGIGRNFLNPAMTGKLLLIVVFRTAMNNFSGGLYGKTTPITDMALGSSVELKDMLYGSCSSCIGTGTSVVILILVAFLIFADVIDILIPFTAAIGLILVLILFGHHGWNPLYLSVNLCGGSFLFTAGFMATDYTTSPVTIRGKALYGMIFGILTASLRLIFGMTEDAVVFALLISNLAARPIDRITMPRPFGMTVKSYTLKDELLRQR